MNTTEIYNSRRYSVISYGNGWAYSVERHYDSATLWLQDDDATYLAEELARTHEDWTYDDVLASYDEVFELPSSSCGLNHNISG